MGEKHVQRILGRQAGPNARPTSSASKAEQIDEREGWGETERAQAHRRDRGAPRHRARPLHLCARHSRRSARRRRSCWRGTTARFARWRDGDGRGAAIPTARPGASSTTSTASARTWRPTSSASSPRSITATCSTISRRELHDRGLRGAARRRAPRRSPARPSSSPARSKRCRARKRRAAPRRWAPTSPSSVSSKTDYRRGRRRCRLEGREGQGARRHDALTEEEWLKLARAG